MCALQQTHMFAAMPNNHSVPLIFLPFYAWVAFFPLQNCSRWSFLNSSWTSWEFSSSFVLYCLQILLLYLWAPEIEARINSENSCNFLGTFTSMLFKVSTEVLSSVLVSLSILPHQGDFSIKWGRNVSMSEDCGTNGPGLATLYRSPSSDRSDSGISDVAKDRA